MRGDLCSKKLLHDIDYDRSTKIKVLKKCEDGVPLTFKPIQAKKNNHLDNHSRLGKLSDRRKNYPPAPMAPTKADKESSVNIVRTV